MTAGTDFSVDGAEQPEDAADHRAHKAEDPQDGDVHQSPHEEQDDTKGDHENHTLHPTLSAPLVHRHRRASICHYQSHRSVWPASADSSSSVNRSSAIASRSRRGALRSVDEGVRQVVAALRQQGELGNTLILFTSDNGFLLGEHRIPSGKRFPYTESTRVPLLARGLGIAPGVRREPVLNVDLAPTIADAAGVPTPTDPTRMVDGRSLFKPIPASRPLLLDTPEAAGNRAPRTLRPDSGQVAVRRVRGSRPRVVRLGRRSVAATEPDRRSGTGRPEGAARSAADALRDCAPEPAAADYATDASTPRPDFQ